MNFNSEMQGIYTKTFSLFYDGHNVPKAICF